MPTEGRVRVNAIDGPQITPMTPVGELPTYDKVMQNQDRYQQPPA